MEPVVIDIDPTIPSQTFLVVLDGRTYTVRVDYLRRNNSWVFSLYDAAENPLVVGERVSRDWPIFRGQSDTRLPPGGFVCVGLSEDGREPGERELGGDEFQIVYFEGTQ